MHDFQAEARKIYWGGFGAVARRREGVDLGQLTQQEDVQLRILSSDVGGSITSEMVGLFWFVPGYSLVGGPDVVRP